MGHELFFNCSSNCLNRSSSIVEEQVLIFLSVAQILRGREKARREGIYEGGKSNGDLCYRNMTPFIVTCTPG